MDYGKMTLCDSTNDTEWISPSQRASQAPMVSSVIVLPPPQPILWEKEFCRDPGRAFTNSSLGLGIQVSSTCALYA